jgi:hypothetical protein
MKTVYAFLLALLTVCSSLNGQDFTGVWKGFMYTSSSQVPYELVVTKQSDELSGYSLAVFSINGTENVGMKKMKIRPKKSSIVIEDDEMIYNDYTTLGKRVVLYCTLTLVAGDSTSVLQGPFFTRSIDRSSFKGNIRLEKKTNPEEARVVAQLKRLNLWNDLSFNRSSPAAEGLPASSSTARSAIKDSALTAKEVVYAPKTVNKADAATLPGQRKPPGVTGAPAAVIASQPSVSAIKVAAADINKRKTDIIRTLFYQSDSLILTLYDNGEVDGDTVSVVLNDQLLIARQGLTTTAVQNVIHVNQLANDSLRLVLYAENLGRIPPNTGVLIIQDGEERYQVRFEGDLQRNSAVILKRRK